MAYDTHLIYFTQNSERGILDRRKVISGHLQNKLPSEDTVAAVNSHQLQWYNLCHTLAHAVTLLCKLTFISRGSTALVGQGRIDVEVSRYHSENTTLDRTPLYEW